MIIDPWLKEMLIAEYELTHSKKLAPENEYAVLHYISNNHTIYYHEQSAFLVDVNWPLFHIYSRITHSNIRKLVRLAQNQTRFYHRTKGHIFCKIHKKNSRVIALALKLGLKPREDQGHSILFISNI